MMNHSVCILMATYNGAAYIERQLDSILRQTYTNWTLYIRDDGSSDATNDIIKRYCDKNSRIQVMPNTSTRHGAFANFWGGVAWLKACSSFDDYFFCDQDDIWNDDKIERMLDYTDSHSNSDVPTLTYCDMSIIDGNDAVTSKSLYALSGGISGLTLMFAHGYLWGCSIMINRRLFELVPPVPEDYSHIDAISHDNYYGKFALLHGKILFVDKVCMQYRRHGNNASLQTFHVTPMDVVKRALLGWDRQARTYGTVFGQSLYTISQMRTVGLCSKEMDDVERAIRRGGIYGCRIMHRYNVHKIQAARTVGIYLTMMLRLYRKYLF